MESNRRARFFQKLEEEIREGNVETVLVPPQDENLSETLRALLPVTDDGDPSLLEIMDAPYVDGADVLIFYITIIAKINTREEELLRVLNEWNLECPLGAFGIYDNREQGMKQLYFKYSILIDPETDPEELAETAMFHVMMIYEIVSQQYKDAYRLAKGEEPPHPETE